MSKNIDWDNIANKDYYEHRFSISETLDVLIDDDFENFENFTKNWREKRDNIMVSDAMKIFELAAFLDNQRVMLFIYEQLGYKIPVRAIKYALLISVEDSEFKNIEWLANTRECTVEILQSLIDYLEGIDIEDCDLDFEHEKLEEIINLLNKILEQKLREDNSERGY